MSLQQFCLSLLWRLSVKAHITAEIVETHSFQEKQFLNIPSCLKWPLECIRVRLTTFNDILPKLPHYKISETSQFVDVQVGEIKY